MELQRLVVLLQRGWRSEHVYGGQKMATVVRMMRSHNQDGRYSSSKKMDLVDMKNNKVESPSVMWKNRTNVTVAYRKMVSNVASFKKLTTAAAFICDFTIN